MVGDTVRGRYGEANVVLALARPQLNGRPLFLINGHHYTTSDHVHWTVRGTVAIERDKARLRRGGQYKVMLADDSVVMRQYVGLSCEITPVMRQDLLVGVSQPQVINSIETFHADPALQLYDLVLGGSHTYFVDGYLVSGWAHDDDFNYDTWQPRGDAGTSVEIPFKSVA